jgi:hypothetical protein
MLFLASRGCRCIAHDRVCHTDGGPAQSVSGAAARIENPLVPGKAASTEA